MASKPLPPQRQRVPRTLWLVLLAALCAVSAGPAVFGDDAGTSGPQIPARFLQPLEGQYVRGIVPLLMDAADGRPIDQVMFLQGGAVIGIALDPPFQFSWDTTRLSDGPHTVVGKVLDRDFRQGSAQVSVVVDNARPTIAWSAPQDGTVAVGRVRLEAQASDVLGVAAVKFLANGEVIGQVSNPPYAFDWDTTAVPNTRYMLQARVFDWAQNTATSPPVAVRVANFNRYPSLDPIGPKTVAEGSTLAFTVSAADPDGARDPLFYAVEHLPPWAAFDPKTLQVSGTPDTNEASLEKPQKTYEGVRFIVCDPEPLCAHEDIAIAVLDANRAPVVDPPPNQRIKEGELLTFSVTASDPDDDPLTCRARLMPKWAVFNSSTCTFKGTPGFRVATLEQPLVTFADVQFEFCDDKPLCSMQVMSIDVENVNASPVWSDLTVQHGEEGRPMEFEVSAIDPDDDRPYIKAQSLPDGAKLVDIGGGIGRVTWTPREDQSGTHTAALLATDKKLTAAASIPVVIEERVPAISGLVLDEQGKPLPGVTIRLTLQAEVVGEATTDQYGYYLFSGLLPGAYRLKPEYKPDDEEFSAEARERQTAVFSPPVHRITVGTADERAVDFGVNFQ